MKIQFSQKRFANTPLADQMRNLIQFCVPKTPRYRQGLLVKVMVYTTHPADWSGSYRCIQKHGFYDDEWNMKGIERIITLKVGQQTPFDKLLYITAHEVGHHISWIKDKRFGEKKADKIAEQIIQRYNR